MKGRSLVAATVAALLHDVTDRTAVWLELVGPAEPAPDDRSRLEHARQRSVVDPERSDRVGRRHPAPPGDRGRAGADDIAAPAGRGGRPAARPLHVRRSSTCPTALGAAGRGQRQISATPSSTSPTASSLSPAPDRRPPAARAEPARRPRPRRRRSTTTSRSSCAATRRSPTRAAGGRRRACCVRRRRGRPTLARCAGWSARCSARTIGLALGGGAAFGLAHVGVLEVLDEHRIPVDLIVGSQHGLDRRHRLRAPASRPARCTRSPSASAAASGRSLAWSTSTRPRPGVLSGRRLQRTFSPLLGSVETLRRPRRPVPDGGRRHRDRRAGRASGPAGSTTPSAPARRSRCSSPRGSTAATCSSTAPSSTRCRPR